MGGIHKRRFHPRSAKYVRQLYRSGVSIDEIAYRLDCRKEQIVREVAGMKPPQNKSPTSTVNRKKVVQRRLAKLGMSE